MSDDTAKTSEKPSLSDKDIATYARRGGPGAGAPGTDSDAHSDVGTDAHAATDVDSHAAAPTDKDTS
ncbi:hypothetical protein [Hasllibacter sp. MH4015]|uniref:hypothetical protein n=1 Tax=Hasllibacter sp. MH4015 TaxID=2854029 RepID=UPI001CD74AE8|nr:hypothetical protein [Hasllibacter sp. MH4015]